MTAFLLHHLADEDRGDVLLDGKVRGTELVTHPGAAAAPRCVTSVSQAVCAARQGCAERGSTAVLGVVVQPGNRDPAPVVDVPAAGAAEQRAVPG